MRVLYFTRDYTTHDRRFLAALAGSEHRIYYLRLEKRGRTLEDRPLPPEVEIVPWAGGHRPFRRRDLPPLLWDLRRVIREVQPDLIHAGPIQTSAFLAALSGFRPLVSMSWGSDLLHEADQNAWNRWATRYTLSRSDVLVGDCAPVRRKAIEFGMPDERIVTFPWGVNLERFSPAAATGPVQDGEPERKPERKPFTLLSTRSWEPIYGVDVIARAFVRASADLPDLRLILLGGGSQAHELQRILQGHITTDPSAGNGRVVLPGQVGQDALRRYYRSADLYVSASHSDGTSISLLEAMASGRPVLVSDIPGNREWVDPAAPAGEQVGWLFPDGDDDALAECIRQAARSRERLEAMGRNARRLTERRADWRRNFQELLRAYELAARSAN